MRSKAGWLGFAFTIAVLTGAVGGCATMEARSMEPLLAAAGFQVRPAVTPQQIQHLDSLPMLQMIQMERDGMPYWVVADPKVCKCLYVGNEAAHQRYEQLKLKQEFADEALMTAQLNEQPAMDWGIWGPWGAWGY